MPFNISLCMFVMEKGRVKVRQERMLQYISIFQYTYEDLPNPDNI
jgi:hypothetical protein